MVLAIYTQYQIHFSQVIGPTVNGPARLIGQYLSGPDLIAIEISNPDKGPITQSPLIWPIFGGQNRGPIKRAPVYCPERLHIYVNIQGHIETTVAEELSITDLVK